MEKKKDTPAALTYWKSLEERRQSPEFLAKQEFDRQDHSTSRRDFLKAMGFTLTTVTAVACSRSPVHKALPFLDKPPELTPGESNWYATACAGCTAGCALLVKSRDGRPIKVEGNKLSPLNQGGVCAVGQASLLGLYDESRLTGPHWSGNPVSWKSLDQKVLESLKSSAEGGKEIVLLTGTVLSPSTRSLIREFLERYPHSRQVTYDPVSASALREANGECFQSAVIPHYRLDQAELLVGINADFLGSWISPVEYTAAYNKGRKLKPGVSLSQHIQFESDFSLTGSNADKRYPLRPGQEVELVWELLAALQDLAGLRGLPASPVTGMDREKVRQVAGELWKKRGRSLVLCGDNDKNLQVLVNAVNARLGNIGSTVDFENPSYQKQGKESELKGMIEAMGRGQVGTLMIWGVNPAYDQPWAKEFSQNLKQVGTAISFSSYLDETASLVKNVAPDLQFLESWGDVQAQENIFHLRQPLIAPLSDRRSFQDNLLAWSGGSSDYYGYLREFWTRELFPKQGKYLIPNDFWNHCLHDGVFILPEKPARKRSFSGDVAGAVAALARRPPALKATGYGVVFYESVGMREGSHANNPWNQELPDPVTKVTWGNVAKLAPKTALRHGLKEGDEVQVTWGNWQAELPVFFQPGLSENVVALALGYGRRRAGKVGNGVGSDAYPGLGVDHGFWSYAGSGAKLSPTGRKHKLATTQTHNSMEGRPIIKETSWGAFQLDPASGNKDRPHHAVSIWPQDWNQGKEKWGMVIDLNACTGCSACVISCQVENNVPVVGAEEVHRRREMHWLRIDRYYSGPEEAPETAHQPMFCQHCANAPCETVCPVLATVHSSDGLNQQVYNRCVGTRYCANNCPYKVRRFNWFDYAQNPEFDYYLNSDLGRMVLNPDVVVRSRGVMEKCSMCVQRIQEGKLQAKKEGRPLKDGEIQTACQQSCPSQAIVFGDLKDSESEVAKLNHDPRFYGVLEEINVRPAVGYLTKVRNKG